MPAMDYSRIADLYDVYVKTDMDVAFFLQQSKGCRSVLELTAGTGRLSVPLLQAGVRLSCLDNSPEMLAILRTKLSSNKLAASIYEMDMTDFSIPEQFDLAIIPFNAFSELLTPVAQKAALTCIRSHLAMDGQLICTLHNPEVRLKAVDGQIHFRGSYGVPAEGGRLFLCSVENHDVDAHVVRGTQFYEMYDQDGTMQWKKFLDIEFYVHYRDDFRALVTSQGYRVLALYGNYSKAKYRPKVSPSMIWILARA